MVKYNHQTKWLNKSAGIEIDNAFKTEESVGCEVFLHCIGVVFWPVPK